MASASSFRDLEVWREAHQLVLMVYAATKTFPSSEQYGLISQMRRAAVSVPANIVEGFKRQSWLEKVRFYNIAESSLEELKYYFILSDALSYTKEADTLEEQANKVGRLIFRFRQGASQSRPRPHP